MFWCRSVSWASVGFTSFIGALHLLSLPAATFRAVSLIVVVSNGLDWRVPALRDHRNREPEVESPSNALRPDVMEDRNDEHFEA